MSIIIEPKAKYLQLNIRIPVELAEELGSAFEAVSRHQKIQKSELMHDAMIRGLAAIKSDVAAIEQVQ